jgi:Flp pilus assembly protein TadD
VAELGYFLGRLVTLRGIREWLNFAIDEVPRTQQQNSLDALRGRGRYVVFAGDGTAKRDSGSNPKQTIEAKARDNIQRPRLFYRRELEANPFVVATVGRLRRNKSMKIFLVILISLVATSAAFAQTSAQPKPSPTPRRALPKPVVARGFEKFAKRDASARLIAGGATRVIVDPGDHFSKGEAHYKGRQYEPAVKELKEAIKQSPDWDDPHYVLALSLTELNKLKEAIEEYKRVIDLAIKDDPKILAYYNMGNAYSDLGEHEKAIDSYKQAIRLDPTLSKPHNNLGLAYAALGRLAEAEDQFQAAIGLKPDYAEAHFNMGVALMILGKKQQAAQQQRILAKLKPELAEKLRLLLKSDH